MRFALSTRLFAHQPLDPAALARARSIGFDGVELFVAESHLGYVDAAPWAPAAQALRAAGLEVAAVHLPAARSAADGDAGRFLSVVDADDAAREEALCTGESALDACEAIGCGLAILEIGTPASQASPEVQILVEEAIARISGHASPRGIELALENIGSPITTVAALAQSIENVGRSMVGLSVDLSTAESAAEGIEPALRATGRELVYVRASGAAALPGAVQWSRAFTLLTELRYDGWIAVELQSAPGDAPDVRWKNAERALGTLKQAAG